MAIPIGMKTIIFIVAFMAVLFGLETKSIDEAIRDAMMTDNSSEMMRGSLPDSILMELDIMMTRDKYHQLMFGKPRGRSKRKAIADVSKVWTNNVMPYQFSTAAGGFSGGEIAEIRAAMDAWQRYSCITFRTRQEEDSLALLIFSGMGCWSYTGMENVPYMYQPLSLAPDCRDRRTILHELAHAIGLVHEHNRPDRDSYVTINDENVIDDPYIQGQFHKYYPGEVNTFGLQYDYTSIMHYGRHAFSRYGGNADTITTQDPAAQDIIGQSRFMTYSDVAAVNKMYKCSSNCNRADTCEKDLGRPAFLGKDCTCWCHLYWMYH